MLLSDAGGVGLNLQHAASACINLELPWNPAVPNGQAATWLGALAKGQSRGPCAGGEGSTVGRKCSFATLVCIALVSRKAL